MPLAFRACQQLSLPVQHSIEQLPGYLSDQQRVVEALLDPRQLEAIGPGHYRYTVTRVQVFQLQSTYGKHHRPLLTLGLPCCPTLPNCTHIVFCPHLVGVCSHTPDVPASAVLLLSSTT